MKIPISVSYLRYWNKGKQRDSYFALLGAVIGSFLTLSIGNPLFLISAIGVLLVVVNDTYFDNETTEISHYIGAALFAVPLVIMSWSWWLLIPMLLTSITKILKQDFWLLVGEVSLFITSLMIIL